MDGRPTGLPAVKLQLNVEQQDGYVIDHTTEEPNLIVWLDNVKHCTFELHKDVCRVEKRILDVPTIPQNKDYATRNGMAPTYYAEYRIIREDGERVESKTTSLFGFGIGLTGYDRRHFIGWDEKSIGFHCDDSSIFKGSGYAYRLLTLPQFVYPDEHQIGVLYDSYSGSVSFYIDGTSMMLIHDFMPAATFHNAGAFFISHAEREPVGRMGLEIHLPSQDIYPSSFTLEGM